MKRNNKIRSIAALLVGTFNSMAASAQVAKAKKYGEALPTLPTVTTRAFHINRNSKVSPNFYGKTTQHSYFSKQGKAQSRLARQIAKGMIKVKDNA